jgi:putative SOS response-associated peptidase YedK
MAVKVRLSAEQFRIRQDMCGRYTITSAPEAIRALFRYQEQPNFTLLINARGESVIDKPAFRAAMKRRRCLIPADGFYEWKPVGGRKQPYFARLKTGRPMALAGLWETWTGPNGEELETAAIVTTNANRTLGAIHGRMPVILAPDAFDLWLNCAEVDATTAAALIQPAPEDLLELYPVSPAVNRTANDNPQLVEPVAAEAEPAAASAKPPARAKRAKEKKDSGQGALF